MRAATVIGGRGYIGSALVARLMQEGIDVWVPQRNDPELFTRDLGTVFYCAGVTTDFRLKLGETLESHVSLVSEVLARARFDSLLYLSSTRVYMRAHDTREDVPLYVNPCDLNQFFNITKIVGEALCLAHANPAVRVARLSNVVGANAPVQTFLPSIVKDAIEKKRVHLRSAMNSSKDYITLGDAVEALMCVCARGAHRVYNVASGRNTTNAEVVERIASRTGVSVTVEAGAPSIVFEPIDTTRLRELGLAPRQNILDDLDDLITYYEGKTR